MQNIVEEPIVQARRLERLRANEPFSSVSVVDISHVQGGIYMPSNGRIPLDILPLPPLSGDHWKPTVVREIRGA